MKKSVFLIITTYLSIIIIGALLLMLPISTQTGSIKPENALFTSTSAITVTGLIVVDTSTYFTFFGKLVILTLLQCGGLGFMLFSTLIILLVGKSISLRDKIIIENDFTAGTYKNIKELIKKVFLLTFGFELIGSIMLFFQFSNMGLKTRIFSSIFHSISAFCNAGFSIFNNSLENYTNNLGINITFVILIISGGLGFLVLNELFSFIKIKNKHLSKISLHSKLVIITSITLIIVGFLIIFIEELLNKSNTLSYNSKILSALFQSVTARTAGFNTINLNLLSYASIFFILILMFIGASPGSTGGGIKTSSAGMVVAYFRSRLKGKDKTDIFYRSIPAKTIEKAFLVIIISLILISVSFLLLLSFETKFKLIELLFEVISAFGTVGLSLGITAELSLPSKIIIMITMFIGRIGPLTILIALSKRKSKAIINYPQENIMIG